MNARRFLILFVALLAVAGLRHAGAQQPGTDAFERGNCEQEFTTLRGAVDKRGIALQNVQKGKTTAQDVCRLLRDYITHEAKLLKFLTEKKDLCGVPDQVVGSAKVGHTKATEMRDKVCQAAAAQQAAPPPPAPSQGLSGALGGSTVGGPPPEAAGGSGVFDSLTGNVLKR